jgi:hypothetical protein
MLFYRVMLLPVCRKVSLNLAFAYVIACVPAHGLMLQAQVEHSERLQPVSNALAPGEVYDPRNLPTLPDSSAANHWYKVPRWLAGKWHKDSQTDYYRYDYTAKQTDTTTRVTEARGDGIWGTQIDDQGQIWQFNPAPFVTTLDGGDQTVVQIVTISEPVEDTDQYFVRRSVDTQIKVDKASNVIKAVESGEQITAYVAEENGLIKRESSSKVFDRFGQPLVLGKSFSYEKRIADFAPQDNYQGKDLRAMFQEFLGNLKKASTQ